MHMEILPWGRMVKTVCLIDEWPVGMRGRERERKCLSAVTSRCVFEDRLSHVFGSEEMVVWFGVVE